MAEASPVAAVAATEATQAPPAAEPGKLPTWEEAKGKAAPAKKPAKAAETKEPAASEPEEKTIAAREWAAYKHKTKLLKAREAAYEAKAADGQRSAAAIEARQAELEKRSQFLESIEMDPKAFVTHFAKKLGISETKVINQLNQFFLEGKNPVELELDKVKAKLSEKEKADKDAEAAKETAAEQAKIDTYKVKIAEHVKARDDDYPLCGTYPPELVAEAAWERIKQHHARTGQSIPLDRILESLEKEEEAKFRKSEERYKRKLGSAEQEPENPLREGADKAASRVEQQRPSTLTHQLATTRTTNTRQLTDKEAWEEAKRNSGLNR